MVPIKVKTAWAKIVEDAEIAGEQRAFALPGLRPYLADRRTLRTLCAGLAVLTRRLLHLIRKGMRAAVGKPAAAKGKAGALDTLETLGIGALVLIIGGTTVVSAAATTGPRLLPYLPIITGIAVPALLAAAWVAAPPAPGSAPQDTPRAAPPVPIEDQLACERAALLHLLDEATRGRNGAHLPDIHAATSAHPLFEAVPKSRTGALLKAYGVPVERSLSVGGIEGRSGVRRTAVEALLAALPSTEAPTPENPTESAPDLHESRSALGPLSADSRAALGPVDALPAP